MLTGLTDIHCHILPGVDDGAQTMEDAMQLLRMEYAQGVRQIILPPHLRAGMFETPAEVIEDRFLQMKEQAKQSIPDLALYLGCEFHRSEEMTSVLQEDSRRTMSATRYVLTEFSGRDSYEKIRTITNRLLQCGFLPVLAHVERYPAMYERGRVQDLVSMGAYIQVNAASVTGADGRQFKKFCKSLLKEDLVHFIATDAHNADGRAPNLGACVDYLSRKFGESEAERLLIANPTRLLANNYI